MTRPLLLLLGSVACNGRHWDDARPLPTTPPDPARLARKAALLTELGRLSDTPQVLLGQNAGQSDLGIDRSLVDELPEVPAVVGFDLGEATWDNPLDDTLPLALDVVAAGGVVTCSASLANPHSRHSVKSRRMDWAALLRGDGETRARWEQSKVNLGNMLQRLEDEDILVLWRPFHESTGDWFWWSTATPEEYRALWSEVHDYLVDERQLDNLLWVYGPAATTSDVIRSPMSDWPGDDLVDVVGVSFYGEDPENLEDYGLRELRGTGKPVAATELGPPFWEGDDAYDARPFQVLPELRVSYALFWSSWSNHHMSLGDLRHGEALIAAPELLTTSDWQAPSGP